MFFKSKIIKWCGVFNFRYWLRTVIIYLLKIMRYIKKSFIFYNNNNFSKGSFIIDSILKDITNKPMFFNKKFQTILYSALLNLLNYEIRNNAIYQFLKFSYYRFSFIVGLWFKKKINKRGGLFYLYLGNRHWIIIPVFPNLKIFPVKKRSVIFFSNSKTSLFKFIGVIKNLRLESSYKIMGIFTVRLFRRWLNVRYIRIKFLVTKKIKNKQSFM